MPAIITSKFRLDTTEAFIDSLQGATNKYYLGLGRSHAWTVDATPDTPAENDSTINSAWESMFAAKKLDGIDAIYATVRKLWVSGTTYAEYDDQDTNIESKDYFVISDNNNVYICLKSSGPCTTNPDIGGVTTTGVIDNTASDGYIWKYLFTISVDTSSKFLTTSFLPVQRITTSPSAGADTALLNQWAVQTNAIDGGIHNIKIVAGGTGYTSVPTVTITGAGSAATATATITSGTISNITITNVGTGYTNASVAVTGGGGSGGSLRAIISPKGGFGKDARNELRAHYVAINKVFNGDESGAIVSTNDFRQIALLKNPVDTATTNTATGNLYDTTSNLVIATGATFAVDAEVIGTTTGAKGIVVEYDSANGILYFNQNASTGYGTFLSTENVKLTSDGGAGKDITSVNAPSLTKYSGDILFLENRTPVSRGADQIETIRLVIAF